MYESLAHRVCWMAGLAVWVCGAVTAQNQTVQTPGWVTEDGEVTAALTAAAEAHAAGEPASPIAIIRSASSYSTNSRRSCVETWSQLPAFAGYTRPADAAGVGLSQAAELLAWRDRAERDLAQADTLAERGQVGRAWGIVQRVAGDDAAVYRALRGIEPEPAVDPPPAPHTGPPRSRGADSADGLEAGSPEAIGRTDTGPGDGHFYGDLFDDRRDAYTTLAEARVAAAREALEAGDARTARRELAPLLQNPPDWPVLDEARAVLRTANQAGRP